MVGPLPDGSECTVTETDDRGAQSVAVDPDRPILITATAAPVTVTVTNTFAVPPPIPVTGSSGVREILVIGTILAAVGIVLVAAGRRRKGAAGA